MMMTCDIPRHSGVNPIALTAKSIVSTYGGTWDGERPQWIPGTTKIVLRTAGPFLQNAPIEEFDARDGSCQTLGAATAVYPSPDGALFAMIGVVDGSAQLWIQRADGARLMTSSFPGGVGDAAFFRSLVWSADSKRILFGFQPSPSASNKSHPPENADATTVQDVGVHATDPPLGQIVEIAAKDGAVRHLTQGTYLPEWFSLDGTRLVFAAVHYGSVYSDGRFWGEVRSFDLETNKESTMIANRGVQVLEPVVLPASHEIVFGDDPTNVFYPWNLNVSLLGASGIKRLTTNQSFPHLVMGSLAADPLRCGAYFLGKAEVYRHVYHVDCSGSIRQVDVEDANVNGYDLSSDGHSIALLTEDALEHVHLSTVQSDGRTPVRLVADLRPEIGTLKLGAAKVVAWKASDGVVNHGLVILPSDYRSNKTYPVLVDIHGGPLGGVSLSGSILNTTPLEWQLWAQRGFVVFVPDYRSSLVAGWDAWTKTIPTQDTNRRDMDDIMSGVDYVVAHFNGDTNRLAVYGHSNGGYETNVIITHTDRFKVAVSYEGWASWYIGWSSGMRIGGNPSEELLFGGKPWEVPQNYLNAEPAMAVKRVKTPTLFVSGSDGLALYNNQFMYGALLGQGVPTDLLVYGGEGHVIEKAANLDDLLTRVTSWVEKYLNTP